MIFACFRSVALAGAWEQEWKHSLTITAVEFYASDSFGRSFEQLSYRTYTEWGAAPGFTLGSKIASAQQVSEAPGDTQLASGISEALLFASLHKRTQKGTALAARITGVLETEKFARDARIVGQDAAIGLAGLIGWSNEDGFFELDLEERLSLGIDADQFRAQVSLGVNLGPALLLLQGAVTESHTRTANGGLDFDLGVLSVSSVLPITDSISLEFGGRRDIYAQGIDDGASGFFSIWYRR